MSEEARIVNLTATVAAAFVSHNAVAADDLPAMILSIHKALVLAGTSAPVSSSAAKPSPAQIRKSVTPDALISFVDGRHYKSLKRHLTRHGMSPQEYRDRFGLARDYPMVAPAYSARRSELAKQAGLGRRSVKVPASQPAMAKVRARRKPG